MLTSLGAPSQPAPDVSPDTRPSQCYGVHSLTVSAPFFAVAPTGTYSLESNPRSISLLQVTDAAGPFCTDTAHHTHGEGVLS